jgi:hypothetical protein
MLKLFGPVPCPSVRELKTLSPSLRLPFCVMEAYGSDDAFQRRIIEFFTVAPKILRIAMEKNATIDKHGTAIAVNFPPL